MVPGAAGRAGIRSCSLEGNGGCCIMQEYGGVGRGLGLGQRVEVESGPGWCGLGRRRGYRNCASLAPRIIDYPREAATSILSAERLYARKLRVFV